MTSPSGKSFSQKSDLPWLCDF